MTGESSVGELRSVAGAKSRGRRPSGWMAVAGRELVLAPRYRLLVPGRLPAHVRRRLGPAASDPALGGVLVPGRGLGGEPLVVEHEVAALLGALKRPGRVPQALARRFGSVAPDVVGGLVLDGVLAVRDGSSWLTGADAYGTIIARACVVRPRGRIGRLTVAALRYGARLGTTDVGALASRLYRFNTIPVSPRWHRLDPGDDVVASWFEREGRVATSAWVRDAEVSSGQAWLFWRSRRVRRAPGRRLPVYKLYISPRGDALRRTLPLLREGLSETDAFALKVGAGVQGLLRPDKIVAYFPDRPSLLDAAGRLGPLLRHVRAQGVPFTAALLPSGLLSWGIDPPEDRRPPGLERQASWRYWISVRAATALVAARGATRPRVPAWDFALARLALEGIDVRSFAPVGRRWGAAPDE